MSTDPTRFIERQQYRVREATSKLARLQPEVIATQNDIERMRASIVWFQELLDHPFIKATKVIVGEIEDANGHGFCVKHPAFCVDIVGDKYHVELPVRAGGERILTTNSVDKVVAKLQKMMDVYAATQALREPDKE